jgi:cobalamin biosynthesis Mg chelatase CobN
MHGVSANSPLPPSVEAAYYRKCIELKRRIEEIERNNDHMRQRKGRITRAIKKLRLERAFLLEALSRQMDENADDSDKSTTPLPTVSIFKNGEQKQGV